jgi:hypothetical protein
LADSPSRIEFFRTMIDTAWQETQNKELAWNQIRSLSKTYDGTK